MGWIKHWAIIATRFRCAHTIYTAILRPVCGLVNAQTQRWQAAKAACCAFTGNRSRAAVGLHADVRAHHLG